MANKVIVSKDKLNAIGDAIRKVTENNDKYTLNEIAEMILKIGGKYEENIVDVSNRIYTVRLNLEDDNPETWGTWTDDAVGLEEINSSNLINNVDLLMKYYPVALNENGEEIEKINPNNFTKNIINDKLVNDNYIMIKFPILGYRIRWAILNQVLEVSITDLPNQPDFHYIQYNDKDCESIYVGAYQGEIQEGKLLSKRGALPNTSKSVGTFRDAAHNIGEGFECFTISVLTYLQCCALVKYRGRNLRKIIGLGRYTGNRVSNGILTEDKGMFYGDINNSTIPIKCFGIENLWGNYYNILEGIYVYSNIYKVKEKNFTMTGDSSYNYRYELNGDHSISAYGSGYFNGILKAPYGNNMLGFLPVKMTDSSIIEDGIADHYFCGGVQMHRGWDGSPRQGGYNEKYGGLFNMETVKSDDWGESADDFATGRLVYFKTKE